MKLENSRAAVIARLSALALLVVAGTAPSFGAEKVEVMHFWTSGGEAAALQVIKDKVEAGGVIWQDAAVAGGGGDGAKAAMQSRIAGGNPPGAMLMLGYTIIDWAREGMLANLNNLAAEGKWDDLLPKPVKDFTRVDGVYVSVPTNVHRINMIWVSKAAFAKIGAEVPKSWADFEALAPRFRAAGIVPLAHGGQPWQDLTLFENVALATGGSDFYRKAFMELDPAALDSDTMVRVFDELRKVRGLVDDGFSGRDWNLATAMVINDQAAIQVMGDWAKGEFRSAGKVPGKDFGCYPAFGTEGTFDFLVNSLSMFELSDEQAKAGQATLARAIMDPDVQRRFNIEKGSIPAEIGVSIEGFDDCALTNIREFEQATASGNALPTFAYSHAAPSVVVGAATDVVTEFFNSGMSSRDAVKKLATGGCEYEIRNEPHGGWSSREQETMKTSSDTCPDLSSSNEFLPILKSWLRSPRYAFSANDVDPTVGAAPLGFRFGNPGHCSAVGHQASFARLLSSAGEPPST